MIGGGAEVTLLPFLSLVSGLFGGIELVDDPLPCEHARLDAAGLGEPAELLDPLGGQPQPVDRVRPARSTTVGQLDVSGGLGGDPVEGAPSPLAAQVHTIEVERDVLARRCSSSLHVVAGWVSGRGGMSISGDTCAVHAVCCPVRHLDRSCRATT